MRQFMSLSFVGILVIFSAQIVHAKTTCSATCHVSGKQFYFSFDRIDAATAREGTERCMRIPAHTETIAVSAGSSTETACFNYIDLSSPIEATDLGEWLAKNELEKFCVDANRKGDSRGYDWTQGEVKNVTCKNVE